jgi:hypothetical protein
MRLRFADNLAWINRFLWFCLDDLLTLYGYSARQNNFPWRCLYHLVYELSINLAKENSFQSTA